MEDVTVVEKGTIENLPSKKTGEIEECEPNPRPVVPERVRQQPISPGSEGITVTERSDD